jgi:hypothetical protein
MTAVLATRLAPGAEAAPLQARETSSLAAAAAGDRWERTIGLVIAGFVMLVFLISNPARHNFYEHFTWQAAAWLEGQAGIRYPVCPSSGVPIIDGTPCAWVADEGQPYDDYFQDVLPLSGPDGHPTGRAAIPFPPLPALLLTPFVAIWGLNTDAQTLAPIIGGIDVWLAWWLLGFLRPRLALRAAATLFFGLGTVFWYTSMLGTTWYFAHVVAVGLTILALGIAVRSDPDAVDEARAAVLRAAGPDVVDRARPAVPVGTSAAVGRTLRRWPWALVDRRQFLAGFVLGLACTARLTVIYGLPFLAFVGGGGTPARRVLSAGLGAAVPVLALLAYNVVTTGQLFHPAYEYLYQREATGYPDLGYNPAWSIEDLRYIPKNLGLMLAGMPDVMPVCLPGDPRSLFSATCPVIVPQPVGMSLLLTSPGWLLVIPAVLRIRHSRLIAGATLGVVAIAIANLMHFSQGWVQFGYRFSNDFAPFALLLAALGILGLGRVRGRVALLVGVSIAINAWGVVWGLILSW